MRHYPHLKAGQPAADAGVPGRRGICVLIVTDHSAYDWPFIVQHAPLVIDTRNATKGTVAAPGRVVKA